MPNSFATARCPAPVITTRTAAAKYAGGNTSRSATSRRIGSPQSRSRSRAARRESVPDDTPSSRATSSCGRRSTTTSRQTIRCPTGNNRSSS